MSKRLFFLITFLLPIATYADSISELTARVEKLEVALTQTWSCNFYCKVNRINPDINPPLYKVLSKSDISAAAAFEYLTTQCTAFYHSYEQVWRKSYNYIQYTSNGQEVNATIQNSCVH